MIRNRQTWLGCLLALSIGPAFAAPPAKAPHPAPAPAASVATPAAASSIANAASDVPSLSEIQTFTRAFELIKQAYVAPVGNRKLIDSVLRWMVDVLDRLR
jgi:carboxyl-terminal processing protease